MQNLTYMLHDYASSVQGGTCDAEPLAVGEGSVECSSPCTTGPRHGNDGGSTRRTSAILTTSQFIDPGYVYPSLLSRGTVDRFVGSTNS